MKSSQRMQALLNHQYAASMTTATTTTSRYCLALFAASPLRFDVQGTNRVCLVLVWIVTIAGRALAIDRNQAFVGYKEEHSLVDDSKSIASVPALVCVALPTQLQSCC